MRSSGGVLACAAFTLLAACSTREGGGDGVYVGIDMPDADEPGLRLDGGRPDDVGPPDTSPPDARPDARMDGADGADGSDHADAHDGGSPDARPDGDARPDADATGDADATVVLGCPAFDLGSATGEVATGSTAGGTNSLTPTCSYSSSAPDVSYLWTAPADGTYAFDSFGSSFDTVLYALDYATMTCTGTSLGCNDDSSGVQSSFRVTVTAGQKLVIVIDGYSSGSGDYKVNINTAAAAETECRDMVDDDRDGYLDCSDSDCSSMDICVERACNDSVDNDTDGLTDCSDYDCRYTDDCREMCTGGGDEDGDGAIDCADYDCSYEPGCRETACADGADDDGDGMTDCRDYDCNYDTACVESVCDDGIDNDGNGSTDCDEYDCYYHESCGEYYCSNGTSDDMDGKVDCEDSECRCDAACVVDSCPGEDAGSRMGRLADGMLLAGDCSVRSSYCGGSGAERMYRWKAPSAGSYTFRAIGLGGFDTVLYLLDSCDTAYGEEIACNDNVSWDSPDKNAVLTTTLAADQQVIIVVDGYSNTTDGRYELLVTGP